MTQPVFNFPFHSVTHSYPKGTAFQFGKGYQFNAAPQVPVQRIFRLHFNALQWFVNTDGTIDYVTNTQWNLGALIQFYESVRTSQAFTYNHPAYGALTVKWSADNAFEIPKSLDGGTGATDMLEIFFVEQLL